jgi:4-hydroxy-4-methyl-2-oxoglutarate aldolase
MTVAVPLPVDDQELFEVVRTALYTPVVGDVLDALGYLRQTLHHTMHPLAQDMVLVGRAMPVLIADVSGPQSKPFGRLTEALDQLQPGEVYLARGGRTPCAAWGELLTAIAAVRGATGAVIDGYHLDTRGVLAQDWPVFSRGSCSQDAAVRASVVDFRVPVDLDGVSVQPGDLIIGDRDGVIALPQDIERQVLTLALEKASAENTVRAAIESGMSSTEAFATYGVL